MEVPTLAIRKTSTCLTLPLDREEPHSREKGWLFLTQSPLAVRVASAG